MLERATACLKPGAARSPLQIVCKTPKSRRLLHSTFWEHGASQFELPLWLAYTQPPSHGATATTLNSPPGSHFDIGRGGFEGRGHAGIVPDGIFLDFLYPPQLLAWFDAKQKARWNTREGRRFPEGFVVASRGYASASQPSHEGVSEDAPRSSREPHSVQMGLEEEMGEEMEDTEASSNSGKTSSRGAQMLFQPMNLQGPRKDPVGVYDRIAPMRKKGVKCALPNAPIVISNGDSTADLAEPITPATTVMKEDKTHDVFKMKAIHGPIHLSEPANPLQNLWRSLQSSDSSAELVGPEQSETITRRVWTLYVELDADSKNDSRLRSEVFLWLLRQGNTAADGLGENLYSSLPLEARNLDIYRAALLLFLRRRKFFQAKKVHADALCNIENGHEISKSFFRYALNAQLWRLTTEIEKKHRQTYGETARSNQIPLFWFNVSETEQLLQKVIPLSTYLSMPATQDDLDEEQCTFFCTLIREAVEKELLTADQQVLDGSKARNSFRATRLRGLFSFLVDKDKNVAPFLSSFIMTLSGPESRFKYSEYHEVVSYVYNLYRRIPDVIPTENFLMGLLRWLATHEPDSKAVMRKDWIITIKTITEDWNRLHGKLSIEGLSLILKFYSQQGNVESFEFWWRYSMETYPLFADRKSLLWTSVYLHTCRVDLGAAQLAFADIKRTTREHGETPDLRSWNLLILAHARVDDLQGGLLSLHQLIHEAKLTPDVLSFHPITEMFGRRGEVEAVQKLLQQYDELTSEPRQTSLYGSLIQAHIRSEQFDAAESVMREVTLLVQDRKVNGPRTLCFNILLKSLAVRFRADSVLRVFRWMRSRGVTLDANSYSQLMYCLCAVRQVHYAANILDKVMPQRNIAATAVHYAICMNGYNLVGMHKAALWTHRQMRKRKIASSISTRMAYLAAKAALEGSRLDKVSRTKPLPLQKTIDELTEALDSNKSGGNRGQEVLSGWNDFGEATHGALFETVMRANGKRRCFDAVHKLFQQYMALSGRDKAGEPPPLRITVAMLDAYSATGEYKEAEECWQLAKKLVDKSTAPVKLIDLDRRLPGSSASGEDVDPPATDKDKLDYLGDLEAITGNHTIPELTRTEPTANIAKPVESIRTPLQRPVVGRRYMLTHALRSYIASLNKQNRLKDEIVVVVDALKQGYALDGATWNIFIMHLCQHSPPLAQLAFSFTERFLIRNFRGWTWQPGQKRVPRPRIVKTPGFEYMNKQMAPATHAMPQYATMVRLADAVLELRRIDVVGRKPIDSALDKYVGTLRAVRELCPKTLYAVQTIPGIAMDEMQANILNRNKRHRRAALAAKPKLE